MAMASPRQAGRHINIEGMARPVAVDHRISLPYYFRIADNLLRQANIYREEKNLIDLYIILLRYSSLLSETIPKHRDYHAFKSREKEFLKKGPHNSDKLLNVISELESLKPIVKQQIAELNRRAAEERNGPHETYAGNGASSRTDQLAASPYMMQVYPLFPILKWNHQEASQQGVEPDRHLVKSYASLPYPKDETLSRHSILGPNGLHGQWTRPVTSVKIQYPSYPELTQSNIPSLVPAILNQNDSHGPNTTSLDGLTNNNGDMQSVLSLDDGQWSLPVKETASVSPANSLTPTSPGTSTSRREPISPSRVADPRPGAATCDTGRFQNLHVPVALMESFLRLAEANTAKNLETCGILAGNLKKRTFYVTTLIIPKQESTSDSCQATNEEEIFEVQDKGSLFTLGWIHTHPTQTCFLSSIDLHNHYSYQVMLPEAIAIVMAPTDTTRKHGIFHLTDPGGMGVIHDCQESGFHPHEEPLDGTSIYEHCSHVYMNPTVKFDMIDLRRV
ncbi:hypothetical protein ZWY2020_053538 [Hordeum vulgare]|nr:hypothetical protein ZWY2020_053538 [Hordeum vulgare]